jgi:hypothetical protein
MSSVGGAQTSARLASFSSSTQSQCKKPAGFQNKDLRNLFGPIRDQGQYGWCNAYAAADIAQAVMERDTGKSVAALDKISPLGLGIDGNSPSRNEQYEKYFKQLKSYQKIDSSEEKAALEKSTSDKSDLSEPNGAVNGTSLQWILDHGACTEKEVRSSYLMNGDVYDSSGLPEKPLHADFYKFSESLESYTKDRNSASLCDAAKIGSQVFNKNMDEVAQVISASAKNEVAPLTGLINSFCKPKPILSKDQYRVQTTLVGVPKTADEIIKEVDSQLDKDNPISLGFDSNFISGGPEVMKGQDGGHVAVIVGKTWNCETNKPEYIVRSSSGSASCDSDKDSYQTVPFNDPRSVALDNKSEACSDACGDCTMSDEKEKKSCADRYKACRDKCSNENQVAFRKLNGPAPFRCENGYFIIPADEIKKSMHSISYFEKK